jgi:23S rRNA pseudouridine2457 synthase
VKQFNYYLIHKPYKVLTQFTDSEGRQTLSSLVSLDKDVYPVGRLDYDSEGLLLLTNDTRINSALLSPARRHEKEYYVLIEGKPDETFFAQLRKGVMISGQKTLPASGRRIELPDWLAHREPPPAIRLNKQYAWISITINEGKNRQVRRMTAKLGCPTLRLIRWRIENITMEGLTAGQYRKLTASEQAELLRRLNLA